MNSVYVMRLSDAADRSTDSLFLALMHGMVLHTRTCCQGILPTLVDILTGVDMSVADPVLCCAPLASSSLSDEEAEATAELFKALGDPTRVRILNLIARSGVPVCACDLNEPVGLTQPTVSHHLKKLVDAGLLEREQRGKWAFFSLKREAVEKLAAVADLKGVCC
jgi:ArsR family transcriptional regulator, arsenate/arsenite/antimonite-responsive transcriptional repressor